MLRNKIGPVLTLEMGRFFVYFSSFFENPLLSAGRMRFSKTKNGPVFNTRKGKNWTSFNSTAKKNIYIYIYIHMHI